MSFSIRRSNAHRLASALYNHSVDSYLKRLAVDLDYMEDQLHTDILDLMDYLAELEDQQKEE